MVITKANKTWVLYLTMTVVALTPLGNDLFIASLPAIADVFQTSESQLVLSVFLAGLAIAQLFYGPLLDRFGRKPVLLVGLLIFTLASVLVLFPMNFALMLIGRFFQAVGACSTMVSVFAIIRDSYAKEAMIKMMGVVMAIVAVFPMLAPILGSYLQAHFGWRGSFTVLLVLGLFYSVVIAFLFKESQKEKNYEATRVTNIIGNYRLILRHRQYLGYIFTSCLSYSAIFSMLATAPFYIIDLFRVPVEWFGSVFAINVLAILSMSFIAPRFSKVFGLSCILRTGTYFIATGGVLLMLMVLSHSVTIYTYMLGTFILSVGVGIVRPTASAGSMSIFDIGIAGSAAAMFGFFSFFGAAIATSIISLFSENSITPLAICILILGMMSLLTSRLTS